MKRVVTGGVSKVDDTYRFDYTYNYPTDLIHIHNKTVYSTTFHGFVYYFGYQFNDNTSSKDRSDFINFIKGTSDNKITQHQLTQFIMSPLSAFDKQFDLYSIDCFVYPNSKRSHLVQTIVDLLNSCASREANKTGYEFIKSTPTDIEFDWKAFEQDFPPGTNQHNQMKQYVDTELLPKIHALDYFSLAKNVKPRYRKYIKNFLNVTEEDAERFSRIKGQKILIVDDINTSGSTLGEILRIIKKINKDCEVYVFTLIGNFSTN